MLSSKRILIGFSGLGSYGFAIARGIMEYGLHSPSCLFFEDIDTSTFLDVEIKMQQMRVNRDVLLHNLETKLRNQVASHSRASSHFLSFPSLIQQLTANDSNIGILYLTANRSRALKLLESGRSFTGCTKANLWLISSVSNLSVAEIRSIVQSDDIHIVRLLANRAVSVGKGVVAAYCERHDAKEAKAIVNYACRNIGVIRMVETESDIDAARPIFGASLGVAAWLAKSLSQALIGLNQVGLLPDDHSSNELVANLMLGAVELFLKESEQSWGKAINLIAHQNAPDGRPGTTNFILDKLVQDLSIDQYPDTSNPLSMALLSAFSECLERYQQHCLEE